MVNGRLNGCIFRGSSDLVIKLIQAGNSKYQIINNSTVDLNTTNIYIYISIHNYIGIHNYIYMQKKLMLKKLLASSLRHHRLP